MIIGVITLLLASIGSWETVLAYESDGEGVVCTNCEDYYKWCPDLAVWQYRCRLGGDYCSVSNQPLCD